HTGSCSSITPGSPPTSARFLPAPARHWQVQTAAGGCSTRSRPGSQAGSGRTDSGGASRAGRVTRGLLDLLDEAFELGDLIPEGFHALGREIDPGPGAFAFVPLLDVHQLGLFQDGQMLPEVAGGQVEGVAQEAELHAAGLGGGGEGGGPDSLVDDGIQAIDGVA